MAINFNLFYQLIAQNQLANWLEVLPQQLAIWKKNSEKTSQNKQWIKILERLPSLSPDSLDLTHSVTAELSTPLSDKEKNSLTFSLKALSPWRKGPFSLYGIHIDTEWHSDWKWQRLLPYITSLKNRTILDVGCGNGYHLWRMLGEDAKFVVGIEPMLLYLCQFEAIRKVLNNDQRLHVIPVGIEQLPSLNAFDTVFSMGVLYHRRSPLDHLLQLKNQLIHGGELILETLIIPGDEQQVLVPQNCYAKMKNIYFIPSALALKIWLIKCGFVDVQIVNTSTTSQEEQKKTDWMDNESLVDFLDPFDKCKTIEGYSAPLRVIIIAKKP